MKLRQRKHDIEKKTIRIDEACERYSLGRGTTRKLAENAGAVIRIGKCYLISVEKMDKYIEEMMEG